MFQYVSRIGEADTEKAFVAFLLGIAVGDTRDKPISASLGWHPSAAPTHYLDGLLEAHSGQG